MVDVISIRPKVVTLKDPSDKNGLKRQSDSFVRGRFLHERLY
jgi:hypothetical protein